MAQKCEAIAKSGSRCSRPALAGGRHCLMHSPEHAEMRLEAARRGGKARANSVRAKKLLPATLTAEELGSVMSKLLLDVIQGNVSPKIGTAAATITRALLEVRTTTEIETRLAELEARAGMQNDRRFG
jgi:hypothetical protein